MTTPTLLRQGPAAGHNLLINQHVRLRPVGSLTKLTTHHAVGDLFGFLTDIGSDTHLGLRTRYSDETHAHLVRAYRIEPYPYRRIHVFFYPYNDENFWTWCREIGGNVLDSYSGLNRYNSHAEAAAAAQEWLDKALKSDADRKAS